MLNWRGYSQVQWTRLLRWFLYVERIEEQRLEKNVIRSIVIMRWRGRRHGSYWMDWWSKEALDAWRMALAAEQCDKDRVAMRALVIRLTWCVFLGGSLSPWPIARFFFFGIWVREGGQIAMTQYRIPELQLPQCRRRRGEAPWQSATYAWHEHVHGVGDSRLPMREMNVYMVWCDSVAHLAVAIHFWWRENI